MKRAVSLNKIYIYIEEVLPNIVRNQVKAAGMNVVLSPL